MKSKYIEIPRKRLYTTEFTLRIPKSLCRQALRETKDYFLLEKRYYPFSNKRLVELMDFTISDDEAEEVLGIFKEERKRMIKNKGN